VTVHPLTLKRLGGQSSSEMAQAKYVELEAEVTATVHGKLAARKMLVVKDDLEEAYNQAWHGVCEKIKTGEKIDNLTGMLVLVTWRRAVDIYRSNHPSEHEDVDVSERGVEPDLAAEIDDREKLKLLIFRLKGRLNQREREAVSLCVLHGYSRPEAAKLLNVPEPALQKVMDGATKKIGGIVASLSARGCGDEEWAGLMRSYAFSAIEDDREYKRAAEHVEQCASCHRYVRGLQGLAAVIPPAGPLVPWSGHETSILSYLHHLFDSAHSGASALQSGASATGAAAGGGGISVATIGGGTAVKGVTAIVVAATLTATAVHFSAPHHQRPATRPDHPATHLEHPAAAVVGHPDDSTVPPPLPDRPPVRTSNRNVVRRSEQKRRAMAASKEFGLESTKTTPVLTTPQPPKAQTAGRPLSAGEEHAAREFGPEH
jgi:DNA-directed RNA polymerase specialized sigma24 family protein